MTIRSIAVTTLILAFSPPALGVGMKVEPGKWQFKTESKNPMMPQAQTRTTTDCIEESGMTPERFLTESKDCTISDAESTETSMKFKMKCGGPGGNMTGDAVFTSTGKTASGKMKIGTGQSGRQIKINHVLPMGMTFPAPGQYSIEILVNGEPKAAVPLEVVQREQKQNGQADAEQQGTV